MIDVEIPTDVTEKNLKPHIRRCAEYFATCYECGLSSNDDFGVVDYCEQDGLTPVTASQLADARRRLATMLAEGKWKIINGDLLCPDCQE